MNPATGWITLACLLIFSGVDYAREAMGIDWMTRDELRESIPPAYTEHIGAQLMDALERAA